MRQHKLSPTVSTCEHATSPQLVAVIVTVTATLVEEVGVDMAAILAVAAVVRVAVPVAVYFWNGCSLNHSTTKKTCIKL